MSGLVARLCYTFRRTVGRWTMATAIVESKLVEAEDLLREPLKDQHLELIDGELRAMAPAGAEHGAYGMNLAGDLSGHVRKLRLGQLFLAETGFVLARNPDTVLAPDLAFVRRERVPANWSRGFFEGAPDLSVEVLSPDDTVKSLTEKAKRWLESGCQEVWVVNPRQKSITIHAAGREPRLLQVGDELCDTIIPDFRMPVSEVFS
jgi:Uma2 family endonuclease